MTDNIICFWVESINFPLSNFCKLTFVAMHTRSENISAAPKAQHDPQAPWSRIWPMTVQLGQFERESKLSGIWKIWICLVDWKILVFQVRFKKDTSWRGARFKIVQSIFFEQKPYKQKGQSHNQDWIILSGWRRQIREKALQIIEE